MHRGPFRMRVQGGEVPEMRQTSLVNSYLLASYLLGGWGGRTEPFVSSTFYTQDATFSVNLCAVSVLQNVKKCCEPFPYFLKLPGKVVNIFRQNLVCCGRAINSRLAVEGSIKGFKPNLASLYKDPDHIKRFLDILFETFFLDNFQIFTSVFALTSPPILPPVLHLCGLTPSEYRDFRSL